QRVRQNKGSVYPTPSDFWLLVDIKTDAQKTYDVLEETLGGYSEMLTVFSPIGPVRKRAVNVIISGNRPLDFIQSEKIRFSTLDGRLEDLNSDKESSLMPYISVEWKDHFRWNGHGDFPLDEQQKLSEIVSDVHAKGSKLRFW